MTTTTPPSTPLPTDQVMHTTPLRWNARGRHPIAIEEEQTGGIYTLRAQLPGMLPREITVAVAGDLLMLGAEHSPDDPAAQHSEFRYGSFERIVRLPAPVRAATVSAEYHDGILTVRTPLADPDAAHEPGIVPVRRS